MTIEWRLHLRSAPDDVYRMFATDDGRARFWAENAPEVDGHVQFTFAGGLSWSGRILAAEPPGRFSLEYFGNSVLTVTLEPDARGGTDLHLRDEGVAAEDHAEVNAGWVSVLMALKAAVDFGVDLRNHDAERTWQRGYADN